MKHPLHVVLVETAPAGQKGSMAQYANLVETALKNKSSEFPVQVDRINIALGRSSLNGIPPFLKNWGHHFFISFYGYRVLQHIKADIYHIMDGGHGYITWWLPDAPSVATAHDIIPLLQARNYFPVDQPSQLARWLIRQSVAGLKSVGRIISASHNTKNDLSTVARIDPAKIRVVHAAIPHSMDSGQQMPTEIPWLDRRHSKHAYLLHVGNNAFYKNRSGVIKIFSFIRTTSNVRLKIASSSPTPELENLIHSLGLTNHIDFIVNPDDAQLAALYQNACLFLFPSQYEGFGWPPLEAMTYGCPVVCSSAGSLPEVVGEAAVTCPFDDEQLMANNCIKILEDPSFAEEIIQRGYENVKRFGLEKFGDELLEVYREVIEERQ